MKNLARIMNPLKKIFLLLLYISTASLIYCYPPNKALADSSVDIKKRIEERSKELEVINNKINQTQGQINDLSSQGKTLSKEIKNTEYTIKNLEFGIKSSEVNIDKLKLEVDDLSGQITETQNQINSKKDSISSLVRALNQAEKKDILELILSKGSLSDTVSELNNLGKLQSSLAQDIESLKLLSEEINADIKSTAQKKTGLEVERENLRNKRYIVEDQKVYKQALLQQTKNKESIYQKQLSELEKKQAEISAEIDSLEVTLRKNFDVNLIPTKGHGVLLRPVAQGIITQEYGYTASAAKLYRSRFHNGMDFGVPIGTPVLAARDGKIIAVGNNGRYQYGKYVLIEHDNNLVTIYGHLSRQSISVGTTVRTGDIIGYSGNTGYSFGPHLHFSVYSEPSYCRSNRSSDQCVHLQNFGVAGGVPVGATVNPADYL